ncbi:MAG: hypothetical protein P0Y55_12500 [Candidatus Cohnella colombiensis]|uniref:Uncharacterized protein n=1 Tax=Candidatus Cohnella colombiensis TaxID=3121368 RepID=A0AA95EUN9_9BACL|nr:MAG: hypothetical protein P0Y55_12500 [Cohnella sp.]
MRRNEQGSALLLVLFMVFVFMMLGLAVVSASLGGAVRSVTREKDVQSLHLAEKALNEAVARIAAKFDSKQGNIDPKTLGTDLELIRNEILEDKNKKINTDDSSRSSGEIEKIEIQTVNVGTDNASAEYAVVIKAKARVDGVTRILEQTVILNTFPDFLKYVAGSSDGNLFINGSPYLIGDVFTGGKLYAKNEADYTYNGSNRSIATKFPTVDGTLYVQSRKETMKYCESGNLNACADLNNYLPINFNGINGRQVQDVLGVSGDNVIEKARQKFVDMNLEESFLDKIAEAIGATTNARNSLSDIYKKSGIATVISTVKSSTDLIIVPKLPDPPVFTESVGEDAYNLAVIKYDNAVQSRKEIFQNELESSMLVEGDLYVDGDNVEGIVYDQEIKMKRTYLEDYYKSYWIIVNGDLTIDNPDPNRSIVVRGNILVTGNVMIRGNVLVDATLISLKNTTIEDASIRGLNHKQLVLISKGPILINRIEPFNPVTTAYPYVSASNPPILDAFMYTDDEAWLYGVGSAFWIHGGFFARGDLHINAVLGNTKPNASETMLQFDALNNSIDSDPNNKLKSRFIIDYDPSIFTAQNVGLPRVKQISMVIGKKRLVPQTP